MAWVVTIDTGKMVKEKVVSILWWMGPKFIQLLRAFEGPVIDAGGDLVTQLDRN